MEIFVLANASLRQIEVFMSADWSIAGEYTIIYFYLTSLKYSFGLLPISCYCKEHNFNCNSIYLSVHLGMHTCRLHFWNWKSWFKGLCAIWLCGALQSYSPRKLYEFILSPAMHESLFAGCGFLNQQYRPLSKGQPIAHSLVFKAHKTLTPSFTDASAYATFIRLLPTFRKVKGTSPTPRWDSLPRVKASCLCCFWQQCGWSPCDSQLVLSSLSQCAIQGWTTATSWKESVSVTALESSIWVLDLVETTVHSQTTV